MKDLSRQRTRIICTIGPASDSPQILMRMVRAGMNVARINLAHGDPAAQRVRIQRIRDAARKLGRRVAILADLPGPKIRIGELPEPQFLRRGTQVLLSPGPFTGEDGQIRIPLELPELAAPLRRGAPVYLADGFIRLRLESAGSEGLLCRVVSGGILRSRKGVNLPGVELREGGVTPHDLELMAWILPLGIDALGISFVETGADIQKVRQEAGRLGHNPFLVAKIERRKALQNLRDILYQADGIMVARGDLGVETPIHGIAVLQKRLIREARRAGKAAITATQMLESMVQNSRPTRAEVTDVANAILDGTDAVMLSEESAIGEHPVDSVHMLVRIAAEVEGSGLLEEDHPCAVVSSTRPVESVIACDVQAAARMLHPRFVLAPTETGATAVRISRFRLKTWILALCRSDAVCQKLCFYYGVHPVHMDPGEQGWEMSVRAWLETRGVARGRAILTQGPSLGHPGGTNRLEILDLEKAPER